MVRTELAVPAPGVTDPGANKHFKLLGRFEQPSATALSSAPDCGVTLTVTMPEPPAARVIVGALRLRVNPGANTASSVLTIDATARSAATNHGEFRSFYVADGWLGFGLFGIVFLAKLDRRRLVSLVVVAILGLSVLGSLSCGGGSPVASPSSPVANSYAVTVTGNAGSTQASTAITVTVN